LNPFIIKAQRAEHDLTADDKLMHLLKDYHVVKLTDDQFSSKLAWCLINCKHKFRDLSDYGGRAWYFENKNDAALFAIRWS